MNSAQVIENKIVLKSEYKDRFAMAKIKGRKWNPNLKEWTIPFTGVCCQQVIQFMHDTNGSYSEDIKNMAHGAELREKVIIDEHPEKLPWNAIVATDPMQHQIRGYLMHAWSDCSYPGWDMGTGKTKVAVDIICNSAINSKHLIISPKRVVDNWPDEFKKHQSCKLKLVRLDLGNTKKIVKEIQQALETKRDCPLVLIINYDTVWRASIASIILAQRWEFTCLDEAHRGKSHTGKVGKFIVQLGEQSKTRMCLSGTPMPNGPLDIFNQCLFLDPGLFGTNFTAFKARYTTKAKVERNEETLIIEAGYSDKLIAAFKKIGGVRFFEDEKGRKLWMCDNPDKHKAVLEALEYHKKHIKTHVGYQNLDELYQILGKVMHRITKDEALDLPDLIFNRVPVAIGKDCLRLMNEMKMDLVAELDERGHVTTAANAAVKMLRMLQFASGCTNDKDGRTHQVDHSKREALYDLLVDMPAQDKVVVFYWFTPNAEAISQAADDAGRECFFLNGAQDNIRAWNDIQSGAVIAVQIQSGGTGINLTAAHQVVYFSTGWRLADYQQSLSRCHRKGQEHKVNIFHLFAVGTVEETVSNAFEAKEEIIEYVLGNLQNKKAAQEPQK